MTRTRSEHFAWARDRAFAYLDPPAIHSRVRTWDGEHIQCCDENGTWHDVGRYPPPTTPEQLQLAANSFLSDIAKHPQINASGIGLDYAMRKMSHQLDTEGQLREFINWYL